MKSQVNVVIPPLADAFTYEVPENLSGVSVGDLVEVPFGKRKANGFVVERLPSVSKESAKFTIKQIINRVTNKPCFHHSQLSFFSWVADYYNEPLANVLDTAIPAPAPQKFVRYVSLINDEIPARAGRLQRALLAELQSSNTPLSYSNLLSKYKGAGAALKRLEEQKIINIISEEINDHYINHEPVPSWAKGAVCLNEEQNKALSLVLPKVTARQFSPFLLHGVTGSGKTEIYIELIQQAIKEDLGALVVVPEIALTPQLVDRFRARLGDNIAVLHSGVNRRTRWDSWNALMEKRCRIAIGARSGIFAPVPNLGLIVVDEEHDHSFKQSDGLRYNARDLAIVRARLEECPVILGSATPSLESYQNSIAKKYKKLTLSGNNSFASRTSISVVDLNAYKPWEMPSTHVSPPLATRLKTTLEANQQAFILYNRRGFASYLQDIHSQEVLSCPNCSVTYTYHQRNNLLVCHHCGTNTPPPLFYSTKQEAKLAAEEASGPTYILRGAGTERISDELASLFPDAKIDRLDRDTVQDIKQYRETLSRIRSGETQILVGTQMIAKGHDLPGVTLVGVIDCDVGLHMPDFRASERVFHLLTQASGRAGRGKEKGQVVLQTRSPNHLSISTTRTQDYRSFAHFELQNRKKLGYPPFTKLLRIVASASQSEEALQLLTHFRALANDFKSTRNLDLEILGPVPAPLEKLKTLWRWHIVVKSPSSSALNRLVKLLREYKSTKKRVRVTFDTDPQDML